MPEQARSARRQEPLRSEMNAVEKHIREAIAAIEKALALHPLPEVAILLDTMKSDGQLALSELNTPEPVPNFEPFTKSKTAE